MTSARSRLLSSPLLAVMFALVATAALMQSTLLVMIDPGLLGWQPDHGHVFLDGRVRPHSHAWAPGSAERGPAASGIVFTPGDDGSAGSVAGALTVPPAPIVVPDALIPSVLEARVFAAPLDVPAEVPAPPPRG